jgi:hypothetical protein
MFLKGLGNLVGINFTLENLQGFKTLQVSTHGGITLN